MGMQKKQPLKLPSYLNPSKNPLKVPEPVLPLPHCLAICPAESWLMLGTLSLYLSLARRDIKTGRSFQKNGWFIYCNSQRCGRENMGKMLYICRTCRTYLSKKGCKKCGFVGRFQALLPHSSSENIRIIRISPHRPSAHL